METFANDMSLDGIWDFAYAPECAEGERPVLPPADAFRQRISVPGYWDDQPEPFAGLRAAGGVRTNEDYAPIDFSKGYYGDSDDVDSMPDASLPFLVGMGWYRRRFAGAGPGRRMFLSVGGVSLEAWVWLNGRFIGHHLGHSTSFEICLDAAARTDGENELVIAVANTRRDRLGCVLRGYQGRSGGIYRSVSLRTTGAVHVADLYVCRAEDGALCWNAELDGWTSRREVRLEWRVRDPADARVVGAGRVTADRDAMAWRTGVFDLAEWSDSSPRLYEVSVRAIVDGEVSDAIAQPFGLRSLTRDGTKLRLNGRPVFLRGVTEHSYFPLTCKPPADIESYREMLRRTKELGFNWIRFHTWTPSEEYLDAADEIGLMVQVEPPVGFGDDEWRDILRACRKHASVVIYCAGNEELLDEAKIAQLERVAAICRAEAPDALFSPQEALRGVEYGWHASDLGTETLEAPFKHNRSRLEKLKAFSDVFGQYAWGDVSYTSADGDWRRVQHRLGIYERPCLSHEVGIMGTYLDLDLEQRYAGTRIGTDLYAITRRTLGEAGVLPMAPTYYRNSCAWARLLRKQAIEAVRKCEAYAGYDFLGAIDHHYHMTGYTPGIMNEFYELKANECARTVRRYNGASVLLLDCTTRRNLAAGDAVDHELFVSLYGEGVLPGGDLSWCLSDREGRVLLRGGRSVGRVPNGRVSSLGRVAWTAPAVDRAVKTTLTVRLSGGGYELENEWDFWVFPAADGQSVRGGEPVRVTAALDDDALACLEAGGRVALFGHRPFRTQPLGFQVAKAGRIWGNLATVIHDHSLTADFPHDGYCDWQFFGLFQDARSVVFDVPSLPFHPIIEVSGTYKRVRKLACLFEYGVGTGRLIVCTLNLDADDSGARRLRQEILAYAAGDGFRPRASVLPADLRQLAAEWSEAADVAAAGEGNLAFDPNAQLAKP
jgi:hypothetical protein